MRLTMKSAYCSLSGEATPVIASGCVRDFKEMCASEGLVGNMGVSEMRVLLGAWRLDDESTLEDAGVKEGDCLVVIRGRKCIEEGEKAIDANALKAPDRAEVDAAVRAAAATATGGEGAGGDEDMEESLDGEGGAGRAPRGAAHQSFGGDTVAETIMNALASSVASNGSGAGLENQLQNILNVLVGLEGGVNQERAFELTNMLQMATGNDTLEVGVEGGGEEGSMEVDAHREGLTEGLSELERTFLPSEPRADTVAQLTEMGFPEGRVKKALILCRNNLNRAMDWVLEHGDDENVDEPLTDEEMREIARQDYRTYRTARRLSQQFPGGSAGF